MTTVLVVRHGLTDWNVEKRLVGQADIPLNGEGTAQAKAAGERFSTEPLDAVISSDLRRAVATAEAIAGPHRLEVTRDEDLREIDDGDWTGLREEEIRQRWPDEWAARWEVRRPNGEHPHEALTRALRAFQRAARDSRSRRVLIVTHQGIARLLHWRGSGSAPEGLSTTPGLANGEHLEFVVDAEGVPTLRGVPGQ